MHILRQGYPFIGTMLVIAVILYLLFGVFGIVLPLLLAAYFAYFFRSPDRKVKKDPDIFYSPADGTVMGVTEFYDDEYLNADAKKVTIFLSVLDVHVNRAPLDGTIKYQRYTVGHYLPAYDKEAAFENERFAIGFQKDGLKFLVIQIAGILARRIDNWVSLGSELEQGEIYGMIKFGSCTELVVPKDVEIFSRKGDKVKAGITAMGRLKH